MGLLNKDIGKSKKVILFFYLIFATSNFCFGSNPGTQVNLVSEDSTTVDSTTDQSNKTDIFSNKIWQNTPIRGILGIAKSFPSIYNQDNSSILKINEISYENDFDIYIDGIPINNPFDNSFNFYLPNELVNTVKIHDGNSSDNIHFANRSLDISLLTSRDNYFGSFQTLTDEILTGNSFGYNEYNFSMGGPLIPGKESTFFLSGSRRWQADQSPSYGWSENKNLPDGFSAPRLPGNNQSDWNFLGKVDLKILHNLRMDGLLLISKTSKELLRPLYIYDQEHIPVHHNDLQIYRLSLKHKILKNTKYSASFTRYQNSQKTYDPQFKDDLFKYGDPNYNPFPDSDEYYGRTYIDPDSPLEPDYFDSGAVYNGYSKNSTDYTSVDLYVTHKLGEHTFNAGYGYKYHTLRKYQVLSPVLLAIKSGLSEYQRWQLADVSFYGYDVNGKVTDNGDFLNVPRDASNTPTTDEWKKQAPYHPIISYFFLEDNISYNNIDIRMGLRHDTFDPNAWQFKELGVNTFGGDGAFNQSDVKGSKAQNYFSPRFSADLHLSPNKTIYCRYGKYLQMPAMQDIYYSPFFLNNMIQAGYAIISNPTPEPSKTTIYEIGFQNKLSQSIQFDLNVFYKITKDKKINTSVYTYAGINGKDITKRGLDLSFNWQLLKSLSVYVNYEMQVLNYPYYDIHRSNGYSKTVISYSNSIIKNYFVSQLNYQIGDNQGLELLGFRPLQNLNISLTHRYNTGDSYSQGYVSAALPYYGNDNYSPYHESAGVAQMPSYNRLDINIFKTVNMAANTYLKFSIGIINLLNSENILSVYPTGKPDNTGFLSTISGQSYFDDLTTDQKRMYLTRERDYRNYGSPRQIRFGVTLGFN